MKFRKRFSCLCLILALLCMFCGCAGSQDSQVQSATYFTWFDTVSTISSYAGDSPQTFAENCQVVSDILERYHQLFDIYNEYPGTANLATINANAGGEAVPVSRELVEFLLYAKEMDTVTDGEMNVMMGSVLRLWHDAREAALQDPEQAAIPSSQALEQAAEHTNMNALEIDPEGCTVRLSDPNSSLDVGALAKGYATERAAQALTDAGVSGYLLDIGGNIRMIGCKADGSGWRTGVKNPQNPQTLAAKLTLQDTSCVTSGNYERYFTVDGVRYHHIIDKDTAMPADFFASVTVITRDSGLADALSTALFCMPYEAGLALAEKLGNVEVLWILPDGTQYKTPGLELLEIA